MTKYCVTAANHNNAKDQRASEFELWQWVDGDQNKEGVWNGLGKKSLNHVAGLLAQGHQVLSAKAVKKENEQNRYTITPGFPLELELRIAKNDKNFKITDLPTF